MIRGMTGFGSAQVSTNNLKIFLEIKSVNHRYFDISFYLPLGFGSMENRIRQIVQKQFERGRINLSIKITQKTSSNISVNKEAVRVYVKQAQALSKEFGFKNDLALSDVIKLPGVFEAREEVLDPEQLWPFLEKCLTKALSAAVIMREREGKAICADISLQLKSMLLQIKEIQKRSASVLKEKRKLLGEEEFSSYQKGVDVNEELARLSHYIDEVKTLINSKKTVGKNIDFIAQEMQRETNTIGSKLQDKIVSNVVISLKSNVEKIREQAQNIE